MFGYLLAFLAFAGLTLGVVTCVSTLCKMAHKKLNIKLSQGMLAAIVTTPLSLVIVVTAILFAPAYTPIVTMQNTNGDTHIFIGKVHVGRHDYYRYTHTFINTLRDNNYTILHEGIGLSGPVEHDNTDCFVLEAQQGLVMQPNCIGYYKAGDVHADMDMDTFYSKMREQGISLGQDEDDANANALSLPDEINDDIEQIILSPQAQLGLKITIIAGAFQYINGVPQDKYEADAPVIIGYRNALLSNEIIKHPRSAAAFGMAHIPGTFERLQKHDATWQVVNIRFIRAL